MDFTHVNPLWQGCKLAASVAASLGLGAWLTRRLKKPLLGILWCVLIGVVLAFTIGALIWSLIVGASL